MAQLGQIGVQAEQTHKETERQRGPERQRGQKAKDQLDDDLLPCQSPFPKGILSNPTRHVQTRCPCQKSCVVMPPKRGGMPRCCGFGGGLGAKLLKSRRNQDRVLWNTSLWGCMYVLFQPVAAKQSTHANGPTTNQPSKQASNQPTNQPTKQERSPSLVSC